MTITDSGIELPFHKHRRTCCQARALPDGRLPIGFCGPDCQGRLAKELRGVDRVDRSYAHRRPSTGQLRRRGHR